MINDLPDLADLPKATFMIARDRSLIGRLENALSWLCVHFPYHTNKTLQATLDLQFYFQRVLDYRYDPFALETGTLRPIFIDRLPWLFPRLRTWASAFAYAFTDDCKAIYKDS